MMKEVLKMIGVASLLGSAACLPTYDQPAANNTAAPSTDPKTAAVPGTGDNTTVAPLTPAQQTAIWMQGGDPTLLANRAYEEGPIEVASTKHACEKMKFDIIGKLLMGRGVAMTAGTNPNTLPVMASATCPAQQSSSQGQPITQSAAFVYCNAALTLGQPQYSARLGESTSLNSGTATKMMDLYATAATEIESSLVGSPAMFPASVASCTDPVTSAKAVMFNADNTCNEAGITCLQGYPATPDQVALCSSVVNQAQAVAADNSKGYPAISALTGGRRLAIATVLAGSQMCE